MSQEQQQQQTHPAAVAQEFMRRADMKGGEVEAFGQTFNWLAAFLDGSLVATPKEAHLALMEELTELRAFKEEHSEEEAAIPTLELDAVDLEADNT